MQGRSALAVLSVVLCVSVTLGTNIGTIGIPGGGPDDHPIFADAIGNLQSPNSRSEDAAFDGHAGTPDESAAGPGLSRGNHAVTGRAHQERGVPDEVFPDAGGNAGGSRVCHAGRAWLGGVKATEFNENSLPPDGDGCATNDCEAAPSRDAAAGSPAGARTGTSGNGELDKSAGTVHVTGDGRGGTSHAHPDGKTFESRRHALEPEVNGGSQKLSTPGNAGARPTLTLGQNPLRGDLMTLAYSPHLSGHARVTVRDAVGRAVVLHDFAADRSGRLSLDLGGLSSGSYIVCLDADAGTVTRKLVVQR